MFTITPAQISEIRESYKNNREDLTRIRNFIKEYGESDDGVRDASESFEQGWNNAVEFLCKTLGIPLTGEIPSGDKTLEGMSIHELGQALRNREEVVAVTIWQEDDIISALKEAGYEATRERIDKVGNDVRGNLEDCSYGWEAINDTISSCNFGDSDCCTEEEMETISKVLSAVDEALQEYPANKVNVSADVHYEYFEVMICSRHDSFPFKTKVAKFIGEDTGLARLSRELDARHVGRCF